MIAIIDSGGANIASVLFAFERMNVKAHLTSDPDDIKAAERVILPGVGAAAHAMNTLNQKNLVDCIRALKQPVLGICLGMQLLFDHSEEGDTPMLGLLPGRVRRFTQQPSITIPHMGWNTISPREDHPLTRGLNKESYFYFVHSYCAPAGDHMVAACHYGQDFSAIAAYGNFMGCQFHPERSGSAGARLLKNFLEIPSC